MLTLEQIKAIKDPDEKLIAGLGALKEELQKDALARDNDRLPSLKKLVDDAAADFEKRMADRFPQFRLPGVKVGDDSKKDQFSLARAAIGVKTGDWKLAPYEQEVFKATQLEFAQKAASFGIDTSGGFLVPAEVSARVIEQLLPQVIAFQLGVQDVDVGNVGSLTFPRETGQITAQWVGEMETAAKTDVALGEMTVAPKAISAKGDISNLLQLLGTGAAESRLVRSISRQFALAMDRAIFLGATSTKGPVGVANTNGVLTSSSASVTYDKLVSFVTAVMAQNAMTNNMGWAMTVSQYDAIWKLKDSASQPLIWRDVGAGGPQRLLGYKLGISTQLGTTGINTLQFGAWDMVTLFRWFGGMLLKRSDTSDNALDNDLTRVVARMYGDVGVEQPTALCVASD